jgi:D-alanyl-D-alanine carboxypeptidase (penicillin-binding protein 5/6)
MNRQAQQLGMTGTHFTNPDGYHNDDHYTNFSDLVTLSKLSLQDDTIMAGAKISSELITFVTGEQKLWKNTNELVSQQSKNYCPYAIGMKTGQTPRAGCCLLSAFDVKGKTYVIGVFGSPEEHDRFEDTLQLLNKTLGK